MIELVAWCLWKKVCFPTLTIILQVKFYQISFIQWFCERESHLDKIDETRCSLWYYESGTFLFEGSPSWSIDFPWNAEWAPVFFFVEYMYFNLRTNLSILILITFHCMQNEKIGRWVFWLVYTHRQKLSNTTFFRRHCFGSCRTEYVGNGNHIFWIWLQILLLLWALRAKNDLVNQVFG